jgi:hypothetical protein
MKMTFRVNRTYEMDIYFNAKTQPVEWLGFLRFNLFLT